MIGIYKITNKINSKCYIGQSVNIDKRIYTHFWAAFKPNLPSYDYQIYQAIRKYGVDNFEVSILETLDVIDKQKLNELEKYYINKFNSFKDGYNMTSGGDNAEQNCHSGENNGKAKLTKQDIIDIREAYNRHELKRDVYKRYQNRIGTSGFHKIWNWNTWKEILPEYHNKENIAWHSTHGKALSSEQASLNAGTLKKETIYLIRELFDEGIPNREIIELLNLSIQINEVRRIGRRERYGSL